MPGAKQPDGRQCTATAQITGERCTRPAAKGGHVCNLHGGSAPLAMAEAKRRLLMLVEPAYEALLKAMDSDDIKAAVRAAEVILDRAGLGPKATLVLENKDNLANLTREELAQRAADLAARARQMVAASPDLDDTPTTPRVTH